MSDENRTGEPPRFKIVPPEPSVDVVVVEEPEGEEVMELREKSHKVVADITKCHEIVDSITVENLFDPSCVPENIKKLELVKQVQDEVHQTLEENNDNFFSCKAYLEVHDAKVLLSALELYEKIKQLSLKKIGREKPDRLSVEYDVWSLLNSNELNLKDLQSRLNNLCYRSITSKNPHPEIIKGVPDMTGDKKVDYKIAFDTIKPLFEVLTRVRDIQLRNGLVDKDTQLDPLGVVLAKIMSYGHDNTEALHLALSHYDDVSEAGKREILFWLQPLFGEQKAEGELEERIREYKKTEAIGELMAQLPNVEALSQFIYQHVDKIAIVHTTEQHYYHDKEYLLKAILELIKANTFSSDLQNIGMEGAYEAYKAQVHERIEAKLSGSIKEMRHPLTRHVGDFNLRETVSGDIKKEMIDEAEFFATMGRNYNLVEALEKGWISTIWYFQRTFKPEQTITAVIKIEEVDTIVNTTGKELLEYVENRPRGVKDEKLDKIIEYLKEHDVV
ncbi:MAG: hypothetical protein WA057_05845 [Candidatus Magasanikiibacteriota bacterium]